jgi:putative N6-adenine-specific DNA methylase
MNGEFFLVSLPGLEDLVEAEAREWFPEFEYEIGHGGVTVRAPLARGLAMNLVLKIPTRILLRVDRFRCRDFPTLYKRILAYPWKRWVDPACELGVQVSTRLSRLKIKKRIEETCQDAWMDARREQGLTAVRGRRLTLYARFFEDECTLSLDTSGERLHKRGARRHVGMAPLRETIAAALIQLVGRSHSGGDDGPVEIIDPMTGSGTFLLEAVERDLPVDRREFAFETFAFAPEDTALRLHVPRPTVSRLIGYDIDPEALAAARANLSTLGAKRAELHAGDFFTAPPLPPAADSTRRWLFANPPYNERLKVKEPLAEFYARLFAAAEKVARPDRACFLLPGKAVKGRFPLPAGWKVLEKRPFLNGGLPVVAFVFGRAL